MALNSSGKISISDICSEKKITSLTNISLTTLSTTNINSASIAKPNGIAPHSISEFYNYNHTTSNDSTPPNAPVLSSRLTGINSITLSWTIPYDNVGVTGYQIYKTGAGDDWYPAFIVNSATSTSYQDKYLEYQTIYDYKIKARDAAGNWSGYSNVTSKMTDASPIGGGGCFVEGTLITLPDGSRKAIEELHLNQLLLSAEIETLIDTNNASELYKWSSNYLSESRITSPITKITQKVVYKTMVINDGLFEATPTHSQLIQRDGIWRFIPLGDIKIEDNLYTIDNEIIPVTSVSINLEKRTIYPMSLSPSHTFFANGILTHNIKPLDP